MSIGRIGVDLLGLAAGAFIAWGWQAGFVAIGVCALGAALVADWSFCVLLGIAPLAQADGTLQVGSTPAPATAARTNPVGPLRARLNEASGAKARKAATTACYPESDRWETERTSVSADHRRRGLATAVKAGAILALYLRGFRRFGTRGAGVNIAALGLNRALGYQLEPIWLTLRAPKQ